LRVLGFRGSSTAKPETHDNTIAESLAVVQDAIALENGLRAMDLVMDDQPAQAQAILENGQSTYYKLAQGVVHFIEATLGFEADAIKTAVESLHDAEQASSRDRQKAQKLNVRTSSYPPGTEYALTYAEANLMGAISLFLSESMIDAAKAFLRLRKAYQVLDELHKQIDARGQESQASTKLARTQSNDSHATNATDNTTSSLPVDEEMAKKTKEYYKARLQRLPNTPNESSETLIGSDPIVPGAETVDDFIVSGVNCMLGLLQLILSIIPPTLGKVMSLVGFRGDREQGLRMLWKASESTNIHGAIALLALLQFFDGPTQFADIRLSHDPDSLSSTPDSGTSSVTSEESSANGLTEEDLAQIKKKLCTALTRIRGHYSKGALWQLQQGRMAAQTDLVEAVRILDDTSNGPIQMKQVDGLMLFDKTIMMVILHQFEKSAENFIRLIDLNTWSHAFYMYLAGACYVEIYRENKHNDAARSTEAKKKAKECFDKVPSMMGKRKFMAKAMPFDVFVMRKINHWKTVSSQHNLDLIDAIGVSPIHEVMYFWNGFNRMPKQNLEASLKSLAYSGNPGTAFAAENPAPLEETESDAVTRYLLQSLALRSMGRIQEGVELLETKVMNNVWTPLTQKGLSKNGLPLKVQYHKHLSEPWSGPSAIYERGIFEWQLHGIAKAGATRDYLELAANWDEDYELSTRVAMKIKSAKDRLDSYNL